MERGDAHDQRAIRVFVSSTFRDMQLERDELVKRVFPRIRRMCERRGVSWSEVDLRWGVTDEQKAEGAVLPICLAEIERTRPYFIGLLGQRYGWIPDEIPAELVAELGWLTDDTGRSVTEMEILHGVLNNPDAAGAAYFYLRDPAWVESLPPAEREIYLDESPLAARRLAELRERILASGHPAAVYRDPVDLGQRVPADLTRLVEERFPDPEPPDAVTRARELHAAVGRARFATFVERPALAAELDRHAAGDGPPLLVTGASGAGASALVTRWARRWATEHPDAIVVVHHVDADADAADHRAMVARLVAELGGAGADEPSVGDLTATRSALGQALRATGQALIVIDGVDRLDDEDGAPDLRWLPGDPPPDARIVLTASGARPRATVAHRGWPVLAVPELTADERRSITTRVLAAGGKALDPDNVAALVAAPRTGNARFLTTVLDELRQHGDHFTLRAVIDHLCAAGSVDDLLELVLARYEQDFERERPGLTRDVFTAIWAARRGLAESELLELLADPADGPDARLPQAVWAPLHLAAEHGLVSRGGLLGFAHADLQRAVEDRYLPDEAGRQAAHARLAAFFAARPLSDRVADELAWQQADAGDLAGLRATLSDLAFVELAYRRNTLDVRRLWARLEGTGPGLGPAMVAAYRPVLDDPAGHDRPLPDGSAPRQLVWGVARLLADAGEPGAAIGLHRHLVEAARRSPAGADEPAGGDARLRAALINLGAAELAQGELDRADATLGEAADRCRAAGDDRMLASALGKLAMVRRDLGDREAAGELFAEEERLCRAVDDEFGVQASLGNHAQLLRELGRFDEALALLREQERVCRDLADPVAVARALAGQAAVLADRGDVAAAIELTEQHAEVTRVEGDLRGLAEAQLNLAAHRLQLGRLEGAAEAASEAETLARRFGDPGLLARALAARATQLGQVGDWPEAERVGREAELTARAADLPRLTALALGVVGTARREQGDLAGAVAVHHDELAAARQGADEHGVATAHANLGNAAAAAQRYDEALASYASAVEVFRRTDVPASLLPVLANRGQIHQMAGRYPEAVADLTEAAIAASRVGVPTAVRQWAEPAVAIAAQLGDLERAETLWGLIAAAARATGDDDATQRALGEHALVLIGRAQPVAAVGDATNVDQRLLTRAADLLDDQETICRRTGNATGLAACVGNRAIVLRYQGDLIGSLSCLDEQLALATQAGDAGGVLFATANRGEVLGLLGRTAEARDALTRARATAAQYGLAPMVQQLDAMIAALGPRS